MFTGCSEEKKKKYVHVDPKKERKRFLSCLLNFSSHYRARVCPALSCTGDKELDRLSEALKTTQEHTRADSTTGYAFNCWQLWAVRRSRVKPFPVKPEHLCLYLQHDKESTGSKATVVER